MNYYVSWSKDGITGNGLYETILEALNRVQEAVSDGWIVSVKQAL